MDETDLCQHLLILFYCCGNNDLEVFPDSGGDRHSNPRQAPSCRGERKYEDCKH